MQAKLITSERDATWNEVIKVSLTSSSNHRVFYSTNRTKPDPDIPIGMFSCPNWFASVQKLPRRKNSHILLSAIWEFVFQAQQCPNIILR